MNVENRCAEKWKNAKLGILCYKVTVEKSNEKLLAVIEEMLHKLEKNNTEDIVGNLKIFATREAYKAFGKSPSQYRNAAEAMLRRVVKKKGLYHINNVVDIHNLISIASGYSIGSYDIAKLQGDLIYQPACIGTHYEGIGKESINIENLPTLYDELGPFGNPTSDSQRAMVKEGKCCIMSVVYGFDEQSLDKVLDDFQSLLITYSDASEFSKIIVDGCQEERE